jgi:hypothetical protein
MSVSRTVIASLVFLTLLACRHRPQVAAVSGGCDTLPAQGPPGHSDIVRSAVLDSQLFARSEGRLVAVVNWSSDSLAKLSRPRGTVVRVVLSATNVYVTRVVDSSGVLSFDLPAAEQPYQFGFRLIAVQILDIPIVVRRGFSDSAHVYLQAGGVRLCA